MKTKNWNCDGDHCRNQHGDVRVYPLGGGGNLILCEACFRHENQYRIDRRNESGGLDAVERWPTVDWITATVYGESSTLREQRMVDAHKLGMRDYREGREMILPIYLTDADERIAYEAGYLGAAKRAK